MQWAGVLGVQQAAVLGVQWVGAPWGAVGWGSPGVQQDGAPEGAVGWGLVRCSRLWLHEHDGLGAQGLQRAGVLGVQQAGAPGGAVGWGSRGTSGFHPVRRQGGMDAEKHQDLLAAENERLRQEMKACEGELRELRRQQQAPCRDCTHLQVRWWWQW